MFATIFELLSTVSYQNLVFEYIIILQDSPSLMNMFISLPSPFAPTTFIVGKLSLKLHSKCTTIDILFINNTEPQIYTVCCVTYDNM